MDTHQLAKFLLSQPAEKLDQSEHPGDRDVWTKAIETGNGHWVQVGVLSNDRQAFDAIATHTGGRDG